MFYAIEEGGSPLYIHIESRTLGGKERGFGILEETMVTVE